MNLEKLAKEEIKLIEGIKKDSTFSRSSDSVKNYLVDTSFAWTYWTLVMAFTESISSMESEEILKSRLIGLAVQTFLSRPYGKFRQFWADLFKADANSSKLKKTFVDTI